MPPVLITQSDTGGKKMQNAGEPLGYKKQSFSMYFGGGEIWFEHLDGMKEYTNLAIEKLEQDYHEFKRPSRPSLIAVNLDRTKITGPLIEAIAEKLLHGDKKFTRVVFVGVDRMNKRNIKKALFQAPFALNFINDFEKAKEWLVTESVRWG